MQKQQTQHKYTIITIIAIFIFILGMFVLSSYTSPLYPHNYGNDQAVFRLIGRGILGGKLPYVDLFDHKGPVLYYIYALGECIGDYGIFAIQCVFGILSILLFYLIWREVSKDNYSVFGLCATLIIGISIFFWTFEAGALTEEFSMPFISVCILLFCKYIHNYEESGDSSHRGLYAFVYGACFSVIAFIRLNNAVSICAGVLFIIILLIRDNNWKNLLKNIVMGLFGILIIAIPICVYFISKDALYEMLYSTFIYNFKYAGVNGYTTLLSDPLGWTIKYTPVFTVDIAFLIYMLRKKQRAAMDWLLATLAIITTLLLVCINVYLHYFTLFIPIAMLVAARCCNDLIDSGLLGKIGILLLGLCVLGYALLDIRAAFKHYQGYYVTGEYTEYYITISEDSQIIPQVERNSVIGYNIPSRYYLASNIIPCYKYYTYQDWWSRSNPQIKKDFFIWLNKEKPKWVLVNAGTEESQLIDILNKYYTPILENKYIEYYRLKV